LQTAGAEERLPLIHAKGVQLVTDEGPVQLKGVNLGGWLLQETWMSPVKGSQDHWTTRDLLTKRFGLDKAEELFRAYEDHWITEWDLDRIQALGFNVVRVPFGYWNLQSEAGDWRRTASGAIDFGRLDWIVNQCGARGIYVILDLHGAPGFASDEHSSGKVKASRLFAQTPEGEASRVRTIDLWTEVARHFQGNGTVAAYDLLNEPMARPDDRTLWDLYDRIYQAVRAVDADHLISVEAIWDLANLPPPQQYSWKGMLYQTHNYGWDKDQGPFVDSKIQMASLAYQWGVPVYVGEFTAFQKYSDWDQTLAKYDNAGFQWTTWTWKLAKQGTTSWALYSGTFVASPDVGTDSYETILADWTDTETSSDNYSFNQYLMGALAKSLARPPYPKAVPGASPVSGAAAPSPDTVRYEAEKAQIVLSAFHRPGLPDGTESQGFFSGQLAAAGLNSTVTADRVKADWSNLPHVKFQVNAPKAGSYRLTLAYNGDDDKTILVRVGAGKDQAVSLPQLSGGTWNVVHTKDLTVTLVQGTNEIRVSGTLANQGWENIDYIELTPQG
jgi:aryl-phospho-beta-D-glucosidase BglC (GH1 family)